jgi:hypothetical protein
MTHLGFAHGVKAIRDIGYVYADDGQKVFRFSASTVDRLVAGRPDDTLIGLAERCPGVFAHFDTVEDAQRSLRAALSE